MTRNVTTNCKTAACGTSQFVFQRTKKDVVLFRCPMERSEVRSDFLCCSKALCGDVSFGVKRLWLLPKTSAGRAAAQLGF